MNKLIAIAVLAATLSTAGIGNASAFAFSDELIQSLSNALNKNRKATEVGEPFDPSAETTDVRAECAAAGGTAKQKIQDNGTLAWVCIQ